MALGRLNVSGGFAILLRLLSLPVYVSVPPVSHVVQRLFSRHKLLIFYFTKWLVFHQSFGTSFYFYFFKNKAQEPTLCCFYILISYCFGGGGGIQQ